MSGYPPYYESEGVTLYLGDCREVMAALDEGFRYVGIDITERYLEIARDRIAHRHVLEVNTKEPDADRVQGVLL